MSIEEICKKLEDAVVDGDVDTAKSNSELCVQQGMDIMVCLKNGLVQGMMKVTDLWRDGEYFLPDVVMSANAMKAGSVILEAELAKTQETGSDKGKVILGTIRGDIHDIGKNLVAAMLKGGMYRVYDIGVDQHPDNFIQEAEKAGADVIGVSCILTTGIPYIEELVEKLEAQGLREKYKVILGGAAITAEESARLGADGYSPSGEEVVNELEKLLGK